MLREDEDALTCDMAEYYRVFDMRSLPLKTLAALAAGLPAKSRSKRRRAPDEETLILAGILDALHILLYRGTKDAQSGINPPRLLVDALLGKTEPEKTDGFDTPEEFMAAREKIINEGGGG